MRFGIDFDNTLASYDHLFEKIAVERGLLPKDFRGNKKEVRDTLRLSAGGETEWTRLQAEAYGARMAGAQLIAGAADFLMACRRQGIEFYIVSHKTRFAAANPGGADLHAASLAWMSAQGFFNPDRFALSRDHVFFEPTRQDKCRRIAALACSHFIDDLEEVFNDPAFPGSVERLLLHRGDSPLPHGKFTAYRDWNAITDAIFADA